MKASQMFAWAKACATVKPTPDNGMNKEKLGLLVRFPYYSFDSVFSQVL